MLVAAVDSSVGSCTNECFTGEKVLTQTVFSPLHKAGKGAAVGRWCLFLD